MRRYTAIVSFVLLLASVLVSGVRAGEHPWNDRRTYYVIESQGRLIERGFFIRRVGSFEKRPCIVVEEEKHFFAQDPVNPIRSIRTRTLTTPEGLALQRTESSLTADDGQESITVRSGEALITASGVYGGSGRVPVPDDVLFEVTGEWLASLVNRRGRSFHANVLDRMTHGVVTTDVRILEREGRALSSSVWQAEILAPSRPPVVARFTADGRLLRLEGGGMVYQVVSREDYARGSLPVGRPQYEPLPDAAGGETGLAGGLPALEGDSRPARGVRRRPGDVVIAIGETVPAWDNFAWLNILADPAHEWGTALTTSEYSRVDFNGVSVNINAMQNAPLVDPEARFPMVVPAEVQVYLSSSEMLPTMHQAIIEAAYVAVADNETRREETNVLKAVSYLAGWINQSIESEEWNGYDSGALDTLSRRSGDALGQARLFAAMARTLGVPTRLCQGFLVQTGRAVNHCWAEAWIAGTWIPVDTTVSRVGLPAGYVLAERCQGNGAFLFDFVDFMRVPGLRLTLLSAGRETPGGQFAELVVGSRSTYAASEGDWMANLYWGFALRLPYAWNGQARLNSVELTSGDRNASVRCEALVGDFRAGDAELSSTLASLKTNLTRFKEIESRVVSFDSDGATPALFIDFTCQEDGVNLRCRQYVVPRRQRAFRISFWAPSDKFANYTGDFDRILASFEF